jgi:hypothetical protein
MALGDTMRSNLEVKYMKYLSETMKYGKKGANIMIDNSWLEQPPQAVNYENLV